MNGDLRDGGQGDEPTLTDQWSMDPDGVVSPRARIDAEWARFGTWLQAAAPLIADSLHPPADDAALADAETQLGRALPEELRCLLKINNGGREVIGGFDLLSTESIVPAYRFMRKFAGAADLPEHLRGLLNAEGSAGWIPFAHSTAGDYLCVDLEPGPAGTVGQVFGWNHDDELDSPMAPSLTAWLERVVACVEAGEIVYDVDRAEYLPFYGSTGFALAFEAEPPMRFAAARCEVQLRGGRSVALRSVESAGPLPAGCRIELGQAETVVHVWSVDVLREDEECVTDFNVFVEDPGPWSPIGAGAVLRVRGLAPDDIMWVILDSDDITT
jgi:cell wall assembly regulator SMI1